MKSDGAESPNAIIDGFKSDGSHEGREFGRAKETSHGFGKVGIGGGVSGNDATNFWQDLAKVPAVEIPQQSIGWFGEFEDGDGAARFQDALNFAQAGFVI